MDIERDGTYHAYFRLEGAREFLVPFQDLPSGRHDWEPQVDLMARSVVAGYRRGGRSLSEVAGQLREAADVFDAVKGEVPEVVQNIPVTTPVEHTGGVLREIADHVEDWLGDHTITPEPDFGYWELRQRFPGLRHVLSVWFAESGFAWRGDEDRSTEEAVQYMVDEMHPRCVWTLPAVVGEVHEAMLLLPDEQSCANFFERANWSGGDLDWLEFLPLLAETITNHLREHHATPWPRPAG